MQQYRDSRPASGAEHLLSHTWEMSHLEKDGKPISHGFKVSIGSLVSTAIAQDLYCRGGCLRRLLESRDFAPVADLPAGLHLGKLLRRVRHHDRGVPER